MLSAEGASNHIGTPAATELSDDIVPNYEAPGITEGHISIQADTFDKAEQERIRLNPPVQEFRATTQRYAPKVLSTGAVAKAIEAKRKLDNDK